jgi:hypothetical protein
MDVVTVRWRCLISSIYHPPGIIDGRCFTCVQWFATFRDPSAWSMRDTGLNKTLIGEGYGCKERGPGTRARAHLDSKPMTNRRGGWIYLYRKGLKLRPRRRQASSFGRGRDPLLPFEIGKAHAQRSAWPNRQQAAVNGAGEHGDNRKVLSPSVQRAVESIRIFLFAHFTAKAVLCSINQPRICSCLLLEGTFDLLPKTVARPGIPGIALYLNSRPNEFLRDEIHIAVRIVVPNICKANSRHCFGRHALRMSTGTARLDPLDGDMRVTLQTATSTDEESRKVSTAHSSSGPLHCIGMQRNYKIPPRHAFLT